MANNTRSGKEKSGGKFIISMGIAALLITAIILIMPVHGTTTTRPARAAQTTEARQALRPTCDADQPEAVPSAVGGARDWENTKPEARNTKQIQNQKLHISKQETTFFIARTGGASPIISLAGGGQSAASISKQFSPLQPCSGVRPRAGQGDSLGTYIVTAYCPCPKCCGKYGWGYRTASGHKIKKGDRLVAADRSVPFGTLLLIPGYNNNKPVPVLDRGGAIKGNRIDVYFDTHQEALNWGVRKLRISTLELRNK
jgi:3D (Asp-Asp-Asp) domain-containing protein